MECKSKWGNVGRCVEDVSVCVYVGLYWINQEHLKFVSVNVVIYI